MTSSKPVFIFATQRSGTNYLRALLRSTGAFTDFDEVFHSEIDEDSRPSYAYFNWAEHSYFKYRTARIAQDPRLSIPFEDTVVSLFDDYFHSLASAAAGKPFFLVDVKYNSLHHFDPVWQSLTAPKFIFELIRRKGWYVIHLIRENFFDVYLSSQVAQVTKKYVKNSTERIDVPPVHIDIDKMFWNIRKMESESNMIRRDLRGIGPALELTYDKVSSKSSIARAEFTKQLSQFFAQDLMINEVDSDYSKIIRDRWAAVANADEVKAALLESAYAKFAQ